jgi:hypothetical protein
MQPRIKIFGNIYYGEISLACSNPFHMCKYEQSLLYNSISKWRHGYPYAMDNLICIFPVMVKVWNFILGQWWGNYKVFQLQKKMIPVITSIHKHESRRCIFRKFRIITLITLYILEVLCFIKKCKGHLKQDCGIRGHNTQNKWDLHTCYCSTVLYKRSVANISIKLFNKLTVQIKQLDNYKCFKREINNFLLNNSFYTTEEFLHFEGI